MGVCPVFPGRKAQAHASRGRVWGGSALPIAGFPFAVSFGMSAVLPEMPVLNVMGWAIPDFHAEGLPNELCRKPQPNFMVSVQAYGEMVEYLEKLKDEKAKVDKGRRAK